MKPEDKKLFNALKKAVASTFLSKHSAPTNIEEWKGDDITAFQEDLFNSLKEKVSEKWFYTYIKNDIEKLPRIDMLNILSKYSSFDNWTAFKDKYKTNINSTEKSNSIKKYSLLLFILIIIASLYYSSIAKNEFHFCFFDEIKNEAVKTQLDIKVLNEQESPTYLKTDSLGCFTYTSKEKKIRFVVQSPYYKTDTIIRLIGSNSYSTVKLNADDYALMLHYYTNGNLKDFEKRKTQLKNLIADDAQIYQIFKADIGIEIYSKNDFINKLTIPTNSLKNIIILEKSYKDGKIIKLKFMIK